MEVSLVMVKADGSSKEVKIDRGSAVIGREEGCRLRIPLKAVSRKHCEVKIEDDELVVADLGSSNGTFVNGKRVKQTELAPGDLLCVGPIVFVVRIDGHPRQIDAKDSFAAGAVTDADDSGEFPPVGSGAGGGAGGAPASGGAPKAPPPAAKKPAESDDEEDISDLLKGLDLGDDEDDAPPSKRGR